MDGLIALLVAAVLAGEAPVEVVWGGDVIAAQEAAAALGGLALVCVRSPARPLAAAMDRDTWDDPTLAAVVAALNPTRIDADADPVTCERLIGGRSGLGTVLIDGVGDVVAVLPGYATSTTVLAWMRVACDGYPGLVAVRSAAASGDPAALLALGDRYQALTSPLRAATCWTAVLAAAAGEPMAALPAAAAHAHLARSELLRGRNLAAREHLDACRQRDPAGRAGLAGEIAHSEALIRLIERDHAGAATFARQALALAGDAIDHCLHTLALAEHGAGHDAAALGVFAELLVSFPQSRWADSAREQIAHIRDPQADHGH